ncbi:SIS domain-containing protein [Vallitalea pronyensis]|uniref:SIS domain-containing protein n=1 Tax=Vallitalea pronyensis TaxID=1348613 RepID=A0A8J8MJL2_9FIRM|nr:SIS domain-containing protein [Vallitalea pronyensis]QUI22875.1 SIS domain-containing protein [Vallitalea pronyensis]
MKREHKEQINAAIEAVKEMKNINHIYFVACGGSMALMMPAQYILDCECEIPATVYTANEFVYRVPKALGPDSVLISCSMRGQTPETVEATRLAREKGALTISMSNSVGSPLWETTAYPIHYDWLDEQDMRNHNHTILHALVFGMLNVLQPNEKYERACQAIDKMDEIFKANIEKYALQGKEFGEAYKREKVIYTMASGGSYGPAYAFAICLLMEMQWIHSNAIHAGEYFHGPFEITDYDVPFIVVKGIDQSRFLDERAHAFCKKYSDKIIVIDAADFDMKDMDEDLKGYFASIVVGVVLRGYASALAEFRGHPLTVRRYMWKMEY